ncbi:NUDIX domain-containing protein [Streptomyces sp. AV19]|uniref:NUDIX hydrolase n=1 Tax=Streptomyces sp. AV19 TaxID=2793068 RepID=UPI001F230593|nr:NUDIX domain-containing protein [Streptomyces sp. AV19]MDG4537070.1 NUDIX domain-containing protein [Streptomyces sp. AV19]
MKYAINVDVALHRGDKWLLIVRGLNEEHAAGRLSLVGGTVDTETPGGGDVLLDTARREVLEEIGIDLTGVDLAYAESVFFVTDTGSPVVNVVLAAELPDGAEPRIASPEEVAGLRWETLPALEADASCPPWTLQGVQRADAALARIPV